jgi:hypothetical protein
MCDVFDTLDELFLQMKSKIIAAIEEPFASLTISVNIDKVADPLIERYVH